ncbi:hypothetical protein ACFFMN_11090 [Planobispora siamensis]|uniref:Uncharacterized protein n=1 Tax=Planobispora siamensis TaxID=936338 RepID=A0A8J3S8Y9_9ACTN|nr:hypothetical protein [Planobispora siamensis]GIH90112.1 hypothetical protein Psi01_07420 [Planobispora siamensis]
MLVLGVLWMILSPLCLWLLFRGRTPARLGGLLTLAGLEVATIWITVGTGTEAPLALAASAPPAVQAERPAPCAVRVPAPQQARLVKRGGELHSVTLSWPATAGECSTATVRLHHAHNRIKVWVQEGPAGRPSAGARAVPVTVAGGTASTEVRLVPPLPGGKGLTAIDGRTGRPIALY